MYRHERGSDNSRQAADDVDERIIRLENLTYDSTYEEYDNTFDEYDNAYEEYDKTYEEYGEEDEGDEDHREEQHRQLGGQPPVIPAAAGVNSLQPVVNGATAAMYRQVLQQATQSLTAEPG